MARMDAEASFLKSQYKDQADAMALSMALEACSERVREAERQLAEINSLLLDEMCRVSVERMHDIQLHTHSWIHAA